MQKQDNGAAETAPRKQEGETESTAGTGAEQMRIAADIVLREKSLDLACAWLVCAQSVTTTVQGTVYLANGQPGSGTVLVSWPSFTTAGGALIAAGKTTATIGANGALSINLAPNLGSTPAGHFYTAVFDMSDGFTSTEY